MKKIVNTTLRLYLKTRFKKIEHSISHPHITQSDVLEYLLYTASDTEFGNKYDFKTITSYEEYKARLPVFTYDGLKPYIERMMLGERDVLWPGYVKWYAKSSGTTSDKSKFIPVSTQNLKECHIKGSWDTVAILYHNLPEAKIFEFKNLIIGGTIYDFKPYPETKYGDVSAILIHHMPFIGRPFYIPDFETAFMKKWEEKLERIAQLSAIDEDITSIGGVPTWNIALFRRILEITGKKHLLEVWPKLEVYVHGGVNFSPYRNHFKALIPKNDFIYQEVYNASEGHFSTQDDIGSNDMLLFLDNGVFYEFIPMEGSHESNEPLPLQYVELYKNYALAITTSSGLWRYLIGDTVRFTSLEPYRIQITGRTKHFINAFGEEVMVSNADHALSLACTDTRTIICDYTVAPIYFDQTGRGAHEWWIEFEKPPQNLKKFSDLLDQYLQQANSDYEAKRYQDIAMGPLIIRSLPKGTFNRWLKMKGKAGAQTKVPRLSNNRDFADELTNLLLTSQYG